MNPLQYIKKLLTDKKTVGKKGCPACDSPNVICTNFSSFNNDYSGPFLDLKTLKIGRLVQCESCKTIWFVDNSESQIDTVPQNRLQTVEDWNNKKLEIQSEHLKVLSEIGCTPPDHYGNLKEFISIPCKCILDNGQIIDNAIVSIQRKPPVGLMYYNNDNFYFIDQVKSIEHSDLALPLDVRIATAKGDEMRMGYAPTVVVAPNNQMYITNWTTNFFFEDGIKGQDIKMPSEQQRQLQNGIDTKNELKETRIIADWTAEFEKIFRPNGN
jgi:hypothetical protein